MMRVGLIGYGKAGRAVANVLSTDPRYSLCWILRRSSGTSSLEGRPDIPVIGMDGLDLDEWFEKNKVDALVDFSSADTVFRYGELLRRNRIMLVTAISAYESRHLDYLRTLSRETRVMSSPNITLGVNFLMLAGKLLRSIAPFADVEVVEQHFREKPEISGTARKIAESLELDDEKITSLRLGGIVGHHEVIFGFPNQTMRLVHESIRREAFGTGAAYALEELAKCDNGFYSFEDLLMRKIRL